MGYIKEPEGIDFVVEPSILTEDDRVKISEIIAKYKQNEEISNKSQNSLNHSKIFTPLRRKKALQ